MAEEEAQHEPTMEEILSSIRRIISEDGEPVEDEENTPDPEPDPEPVAELVPEPEPKPEPADDNVLELTDAVQEDGTVVSLNQPEPEPEPDFCPPNQHKDQFGNCIPDTVPPEPMPEPEPDPKPEPEPEG